MILNRHVLRALLVLAGAAGLLAPQASAQQIGSFRWQLLPFCNVVTLNVSLQGSVFRLEGFDDQCGASQGASVVGTAFPNPDGSIGIGLNTVVATGSGFVHVDARVGLASLGGSWRDSAGNSGSLVFAPGGGVGGPPRPAPSQTMTKVVAPGQYTWGLDSSSGPTVRRAALIIPEITEAVVQRGGVQVFVGLTAFDEPWTALPFTTFAGPVTQSMFYSVGVGGVVVRFHGSNNLDPNAPLVAFKVVITP